MFRLYQRRQAGLTAVELIAAVALGALGLGVAAAYTLPALARGKVGSAAHDVRACLQLARTHAVSLNHDGRCLIDSAERTLRVLDTRGTTDPLDDLVLNEVTLPATVFFARPDVGPPITLDGVGSGLFHAVFAADGSLAAGAGDVVLFGGDRFDRVVLFGAGGTTIRRWDGSVWVPGS